MLGAAGRQDPESLRRHYATTAALILSIDGLQPEKGHEDPLRPSGKLTGKGSGFWVRRSPLLSATRGRGPPPDRQGQGVGPRALGKPVALVALRQAERRSFTGIAGELPEVAASLLRQPLPPATVGPSRSWRPTVTPRFQMRKKVRGLRDDRTSPC